MKYHPREKEDYICEYRIIADDLTEAASYIASETSIQDWEEVNKLFPRTSNKIKPTVYHIDNKKNIVRIAYPGELFEEGSITQIVSAFYGKVSSLGLIKNVKLLDIKFPLKVLHKFYGPRYGMVGIIKEMGRAGPFFSTTLKRSMALDPDSQAELAYKLWVTGADIVKEDQTVYDTWYNGFYDRVTKTMRMKERAESETGKTKIYIPNVTAEAAEMIKRADFVKNKGGEYIMVDMISCGFSGMQSVRRHCHQYIFGTRAYSGREVNDSESGISLIALAKLSRLAGVDIFNIGTPSGRMESPLADLEDLTYMLEDNFIERKKLILEQEWKNIRPVISLVSGGIHPGHVQKLAALLGHEIIINSTSGIYNHPDGLEPGIMAMVHAIDAARQRIHVREYAKRHRELDKAIHKWGTG